MTSLALILAPMLEQASSSGGAPTGIPGGCAGGSPMLLTMGLVFAIFYFLIIRPSQKREKNRKTMLSAIKPGDTVVTVGGLVGKVTGTSERYIVMEISPKVRVRVLRANVSGKDEEAPEPTKKSGRKSKGKKKTTDKGRKSDSSAPETKGDDDE